ncbi:MAG: ABC transporter ATP-binding protein [Eubacteriales bacterium]|nr:ABC transporter ATP-binding protein [Eubacteriales bacterium]
MDESIIIRKLNQYYGRKQVLSNVNLTVTTGMFGLLGRNGAGKTTLMRTMTTLLPMKEGSITICGIPVDNAKEIRRIVGYLPQDFSVYPSMRVHEAMDYLGILSGMDKKERKERGEFLLEKVNLAEHRDKKVKALSGGMRRRLGIAQALLNDPRVLIVDEPTAGLDPEERIRFRNLLGTEARERIVILSTHIVGDIEAACEDIAVLNEGRVIFNGKVQELMENARGKVYEAQVDSEELFKIKEEFTVTSTRVQGNKTEVRFLSGQGVSWADSAAPNMEDAYMVCLCENNGNQKDKVIPGQGGGC